MNNQQIINKALNILEDQLSYNTNTFMSDPKDTKDYLKLRLSTSENEIFLGLFLTAQHELIECVELAKGTINSATIYPREVIKQALKYNAATVIFAHNHPSGIPEPSQADQQITQKLKSALALIDIPVLDHIIVGHNTTTSFAERGLL